MSERIYVVAFYSTTEPTEPFKHAITELELAGMFGIDFDKSVFINTGDSLAIPLCVTGRDGISSVAVVTIVDAHNTGKGE